MKCLKGMEVRQVFTFLTMILLAASASAKVELSKTVPVRMQTHGDAESRWIKDLGKILPSDLNTVAGRDAGVVLTRIGDKALQHWFDSPQVRESAMGRTATTIEKKMKTEVAVPGGTDGEVDHKVSFQVLALQSSTKVEYKGWTNAAWNYDMRDRASRVEVSEKVWRNKDLTLSHTATAQEDVSAVGVRWSW